MKYEEGVFRCDCGELVARHRDFGGNIQWTSMVWAICRVCPTCNHEHVVGLAPTESMMYREMGKRHSGGRMCSGPARDLAEK